jgi:hypothetical protein
MLSPDCSKMRRNREISKTTTVTLAVTYTVGSVYGSPPGHSVRRGSTVRPWI